MASDLFNGHASLQNVRDAGTCWWRPGELSALRGRTADVGRQPFKHLPPRLSSHVHLIRCAQVHDLPESDSLFKKQKSILCGQCIQEEGTIISNQGGPTASSAFFANQVLPVVYE